jgi:hypothetical protein
MFDAEYSIYTITQFSSMDLVSIAKLITTHSEFQSDICIENDGLNVEYRGDNARLIDKIRNLLIIPMKSNIKNLIECHSSTLLAINPEVIRKDPFIAYCKINPITKRSNDR